MLGTKHVVSEDGGKTVRPVVAQAARELLNKAENERSGVLSTALSFLSLYRDPVIASVTSASDWRISDLVESTRPLSLYLVVPPSDLSRTKPLIRLILNQVGRRLTETLPGSDRRKVLLMLDEFPALGRLDFFESALAFMAGYGVRAFLIAQSLNQIEKAYGPNNSILDNCHVRVAFATNDERTAKRVSEALGAKTELRSQKNYTGHRLAPWLSHMMVSRQETQRQLLTPGEIMQLPTNKEVVMVSGVAPALADKLRYFVDGNFTARVRPAAARTGQSLAPASDWAGFLARPDTADLVSASETDEDNGREISQELEREMTPAPDMELSCDEGGVDDLIDPADARHLDAVRKALALGEVDQDMNPGD